MSMAETAILIGKLRFMTSLAFRALAEAVVRETEKRNAELPATQIVEMKK